MSYCMVIMKTIIFTSTETLSVSKSKYEVMNLIWSSTSCIIVLKYYFLESAVLLLGFTDTWQNRSTLTNPNINLRLFKYLAEVKGLCRE